MGVTMMNRRVRFIPSAIVRWRWLFVAVCFFIFSASLARAGSIFMKNGYIIQGPIVEYTKGTEGAVVLGWPNGKMTIYSRFVERVDFEPGEEKNIRASKAKSEEFEEVLVTQEVEVELPEKLEELVKIYNLPSSLLEGHSAAPVSLAPGEVPGDEKQPGETPNSIPKEPGSDLGIDVSVVTQPEVPPGPEVTPLDGPPEPIEMTKPPEEDLSERVSAPQWGFSIQPPRGWKLAEVKECVSWSGFKDSNGFAPSMNVTSISGVEGCLQRSP